MDGRCLPPQNACATSVCRQLFYFRSISQRGVSFVALLLLCGVTVMHRACTSCSAACAATELLLAYGWMQISGVSALCSLHYMHLGCVNSQDVGHCCSARDGASCVLAASRFYRVCLRVNPPTDGLCTGLCTKGCWGGILSALKDFIIIGHAVVCPDWQCLMCSTSRGVWSSKKIGSTVPLLCPFT